MADLMVDFICSLDGYGAAEGWPGLWGMGGPEYLAFLEEDAKIEQTTLLGAATYRELSGYAQESPDDTGLAALTAAPKLVFSSTLSEPLTWANSTLVEGNAVDVVRDLKMKESHELRTIGSVSLTGSLVRAGLVDRIRVVIFPVITGATGQSPVFGGYPDVSLEVVEHRTFDGRLQLFEYLPTVLDSPPGASG